MELGHDGLEWIAQMKKNYPITRDAISTARRIVTYAKMAARLRRPAPKIIDTVIYRCSSINGRAMTTVWFEVKE